MTAPVRALPSLCSGIFGERLPLRYYLSGGMVLSGLFTALFGLGYFWDIHVLWYFIVVQVRPCWRMPRLWILPLWPHPGFSVAFRDQGGPVSERECPAECWAFPLPAKPGRVWRGCRNHEAHPSHRAGRAASLATPAAPNLATGTMQTALGLPQREKGKNQQTKCFLDSFGMGVAIFEPRCPKRRRGCAPWSKLALTRCQRCHVVLPISCQVCNGLVQTTGWPSVVACVGNWFGKGK